MATTKKLKVVHVITKLELGGAQVNTIYTFKHLNRERFDVWLISGPGGILTPQVEQEENFIVLESLIREINPAKDVAAYGKLKKIFKEIEPDIVHTHSSKAGFLGRLAASATGVPKIIHSVHGFGFSPYQSFLKRNLFLAAERWAARKTSCFVFVSNDDIHIANEKKLIKENYTLIRSGFPFPKFQQVHENLPELRQRFNIGEKDFVCGIIAPFKPQKGLFHLIEIAARVMEQLAESGPQLRFMITGDGALREEIENRLKEKNMLHLFRLPGFVMDIENAIDLFDIGISTALWEGLPQSLVQLRLKKKAVVASNIPGNREVIKDRKNGFLVDVTDYETFAQRIVQLISDEALRNRLANYDEEDFSPWNAAEMTRRQEDLYAFGDPCRGG